MRKLFKKCLKYSKMSLLGGIQMKYGSLYVKTDNSLLNSMIRIPSLIEFAKSNNLKKRYLLPIIICLE